MKSRLTKKDIFAALKALNAKLAEAGTIAEICLYGGTSMMLAFNMEAFPPAKYNVAEVTITMIENFLYGLATEPGFKLIELYKAKKNTIHAQ
jgi:hypothetical protein